MHDLGTIDTEYAIFAAESYNLALEQMLIEAGGDSDLYWSL